MVGMRVALFGGSFDPPHWGHVLAACYARVAAAADEVWVLPVARHAYSKRLGPWDQRWALCAAAFGGLGFVKLRDDELRNPRGYSFDLVSSLRAAHPGWEWVLVGGTDTAKDLGHWHRGEELKRLVEVVAVPRRGFDASSAALPEISSTEVQNRLRGGGDAGELLPPGVVKLIAENGWYREAVWEKAEK
jgi:nicotinate-nucleotide adenylyltransferase